MFSEALDRVPAEPSRTPGEAADRTEWSTAEEDLLRARELARAAIDMARGLGDLSAVGDGLMTYRWLIRSWDPALTSERIAVAEELIALGRQLDDPKFTTGGLSQLLHVHREAGDLVAAASVRAEMEALSALRPHPVTQAIVITYQASERYLAGDLAGAEATADRLWDFGSETGVDAFGLYALILGAIRSQQGRFAEMLPVIEKAVAEQPSHRGFLTAMLARALARVGRLDDAAEALHRPRGQTTTTCHTTGWSGWSCSPTPSRSSATGCRRPPARTAHTVRRTDRQLLGVVTRPTDQALAQLALVLDDLDGAADAATRAIAASRARNTPIFLGRELVLLATARHRAGAPEREILPLVEEAQQIADATGAHLINQEIARYGLSPAHSVPDHSEYPDSP